MNSTTLADTFYIIGIVCMSLYTILLIAIVVILTYIWRKFVDIQNKVEDRLDELKSIMRNPKETASDLGAAAATSALDRFADIIRPKRKK